LFIGQPYQFPIESYMHSLFVHWLPRNVVGVRYLTVALGCLSVVGFWLVARRFFAPGDRWPAVLLVLLPSAYLMTLQAAYSPPHYPTNTTLAWLMLLVAAQIHGSARRRWMFFLLGFLCGLSFSIHMLMLPMAAAVLFVVAAGSGLDAFRHRIVWMGAGAIVGLVPDILVAWLESAAHEHMDSVVPWTVAMNRLLSGDLFTQTLSRTLGVDPPLFPDFPAVLGLPEGLRTAASIVYMALLIGVTMARIATIVRQWRSGRGFRMEAFDIVPIASWLTLTAFLFGGRTNDMSYRYLVICAWCLPFLVGYAYANSRRYLRRTLAAGTIVVALFNSGSTAALVERWYDPSFARLVADTPGLQPLIKELDRLGITHCYASFWLAYRITYQTDERIICSMPYNERFPGWPLPYKAEVDRNPDAVYVLTQTYAARVKALDFMWELKNNDVKARQTWVRPFIIFSDFEHDRTRHSRFLAPGEIEMVVEGGPGRHRELTDGDGATGVRIRAGDASGDGIDLRFDRAQRVQRVTIHYDRETSDNLPVLDIDVFADGKWTRVASRVPGDLDRVRIVDGRPMYGGWHQTIWIDPAPVRALRIGVADFGNGEWMPSDIDIGVLEP
jgi:hypothetical protein